MNLKGQVSVEFIVVLTILFFFLLFSLFVFSEKQSGFALAKEQMEAELIAGKLARTINSVFLAGNGAMARVFLEKNFDYTVEPFKNAVQVKWKSNFADAAILTDNAAFGSVAPGNWVDVLNNNGKIIVHGCTTQADCFNYSWNSSAMKCNLDPNTFKWYCQLAKFSPFWVIENTSLSKTITITRIKVSWVGDTDGDPTVDEITINSNQLNSASSVSGAWNDVVDFSLAPRQSISTNNYLKWAGNIKSYFMNNQSETYTIEFEFSDQSTYTTSGYNPPFG